MNMAGAARHLDHVGLALYTLRSELARDFEGTLQQVAAIGYRELDMYVYETTREAPATRAILDRTGLVCSSARVRTTHLYRGWERFLDAAAALGARYITLAYLAPEEIVTLADWHELAELFNRCGAAAARHGLTFCYHNHESEFVAIDGTVPYDLMLAETEPGLVKLQVDVYWLTRGGRAPAVELRRLAGRVATLHLKDMDATPARGIATVGRGTIDFAALMRTAIDTGISHWYVEEDNPPAPGIDAVRFAYQYLERLDV
jgi:sugar phosphate isomerase/epimerase